MSKKTNADLLNKISEELDSIKLDKENILGSGGIIKELTKLILDKALKAEMEDHLGYESYKRSNNSNSRNGSYIKEVDTEQGPLSIEMPRDRESSYEPQIIKKGQSRIEGLDEKILSLYAKGMTTSDIRQQIYELYGSEISESLVSRVTDNVMIEVKAWQNRPLERLYPIVYFDCIVLKVRQDNRIINKSVYLALGVDSTGIKDVLGFWISENEGAKFWLKNLTELKNRGLEDILIACTDNLAGMTEAIGAVYPQCEHQLCIVHQIRNSFKYVSYKDRKEVCADLKPIYTATTEEAAELALEAFEQKWGKKYPQIAKSWYNNWDNLVVFLKYPEAIRRIIYTTNAIKSPNSQLRKVIKNKKLFPNDNSVFKNLFLTIQNITAKWSMPIKNWHKAISHFMVEFEERF